MKITPTQITITVFVALLLSNAIIFFAPPAWGWLRIPNAVAFVLALPGLAWLPVLRWLHTRQAIERLTLVFGVSSLLAALLLYGVVLLPGPFTETPVLLALNGLIVAGLVAQLFWRDEAGGPLEWPSRRVLFILLAILAVAAFNRFYWLGYAEYHEDELENMRLIISAYKGEEYAPFLDSKGPIHWLLPAALWYLNGWGNETVARLPFAVAGLLLAPLMFALGRRITGRDSVGLLAAALVTLNGFFVAYSRHVENPSLIVFWGALSVWWAYRYYKESIYSFLPWVGLSLAVGLIAHPDVFLYLPVFGFLLGIKVWQDRSRWRGHLPWLIGGGLLLVGVSALFYLPYLFDPNIRQVRQYFAEDRIGTAYLYNRVANLFDQDGLYSTRYHAPLLVILLGWLLARQFAQWGRRGYMLLAGLTADIVTTLVWPEAWLIGDLNLAFVPYALLTLLALLLPATSIEIKTLLVWMMAPLGALLFLAKDAADHIQVAYTAWALLAAIALVNVWDTLAAASRLNQSVRRALQGGLIAGLALIAGLIFYYQYLMFLSPVTDYWAVKQAYEQNPNSAYGWLYGSIPRPRKLFSNPRFGGWKAAGYLYDTGLLKGDFRSINESFAVPVWYTFQTPRSCYDDPQNYWVRRDWQGWPPEEDKLRANGYTLTHEVLVDQRPSLHLYQKNAPAGPVQIIDVEDYRVRFDRLATPAHFAQAESYYQPASLNFGDKLLLRGFDLPETAHPGELLPVTIYWEALARMDIRYRAFVHLIGPNDSKWGQHDDDPGCRLLTTDMRPGMPASRQFRVPVDPATPPGEYQVVLGVYEPDTFDRLDIWDNRANQSPGNSFVLGRVRVE
jgi:4-amino-4-deoxy-L-arabinose transferase-like glycosyltransferase